MKKIIAFLLCAVMLALSLGVTSFAQTIKKDNSFNLGDADLSGSVNAADSYVIKADIAGIEGVQKPDSQAADIDADGKITSKDAFYLKTLIAGTRHNSDFENGNQVNTFIIGGVDISEFTVVLPEGTGDNTNLRCAYDIIRKYTELATDFELPLEYGTTPDHGIYFNHPDESSELAEELGYDGYRYEVINGNLYVWGNLRGNMYAAYNIVEKYLGFYFSDNYYTFEYKVRCANIEEGTEEQFVPPFFYRSHVGTIWGSTNEYYALPRGLNFITLGSKTEADAYYGYFTGPLYHNAHAFYFYEAMGAGEMPEDDGVTKLSDRYYQKYEDGMLHGVERGIVPSAGRLLSDGYDSEQPCTSSIDEFENVYRGYVDTIKMLEARGYAFIPNISYVAFSINDSSNPNGGYCQCKLCRAKANGTDVRKTKAYVNQIDGNYTGWYEIDDSKIYFKAEGYSGAYLDFANRAVQRVQDEYPGLISNMILYDHTVPETVRPDSHLVLFYCGNGCNQHCLGSGDCDGKETKYPQYQNTHDEEAIPAWVKICHDNGAKLYFWYYPVTFSILLYDTPNIFNTYYDFHWLYEVGVDGIIDECDSNTYLTESLKGYLGMEMMWNPAMSYDEFIGLMKKFLYAYYGNASEDIYDALVLLNEAGDANDGCYYPAFHRVWDMYSKDYLCEKYDELHEIMSSALRYDPDNGRVKALYYSCEFLGLSASYEKLYVNGNSDDKSLYESRYTELYNYLHDGNTVIEATGIYTLPDMLDFSVNPAIQFFKITNR